MLKHVFGHVVPNAVKIGVRTTAYEINCRIVVRLVKLTDLRPPALLLQKKLEKIGYKNPQNVEPPT